MVLTVQGLNNHRNQAVVELFERVGRLAPGAYGRLYTRDDEANLWDRRPYPDAVGENPNRWYCRVLRRGVVERHDDPHLSPHVPVIEDDCAG